MRFDLNCREQLPFSPSLASFPGEGFQSLQDPPAFKDSKSQEKPVQLFDLKVSGIYRCNSTKYPHKYRKHWGLGLFFLKHFLVRRVVLMVFPPQVLPTRTSFSGWVRMVHTPQDPLQADLINHCDPCLRRSRNADLTNVAPAEQAHYNSSIAPERTRQVMGVLNTSTETPLNPHGHKRSRNCQRNMRWPPWLCSLLIKFCGFNIFSW